MKKILAHKKLILAAFLPLGFWAVIFALWFFNSPGAKESGPIIIKSQNQKTDGFANISQIASSNSTVDGDKDGLSDWEESIYGTNPDNPDSDGDGYLDGEEILSGRDPLKKGPNDILPATKSSFSDSENYSATQEFVRVAVKNYLNSSGGANFDASNAPNQKDLEKIFSQSLSSGEDANKLNEIIKSELYFFIPPDLSSEIKTSKDNSEKSISTYWLKINDFSGKMIREAPHYDISEAIKNSVETKNHKQLNEIASHYEYAYNESKSITVPSSLADYHKNFSGSLYKFWKIMEAIKTYESDPLKTLIALNELSMFFQQTN